MYSRMCIYLKTVFNECLCVKIFEYGYNLRIISCFINALYSCLSVTFVFVNVIVKRGGEGSITRLIININH